MTPGDRVQAALRKLRQLLYWGLPPLLLYLIFSHVDTTRLLELAAMADHWLLIIGSTFIVGKILVGALRWHHLARHYDCTRLTPRGSIAEYWISLTLGVVVPGSLGSDGYRVALGGRRTGRYLRGAFVIGLEKIAALIACAALIVLLYPVLRFESLPHAATLILDAAYGFLLVISAAFLVAAVTRRAEWLKKLANRFARMISALVRDVRKLRAPRQNGGGATSVGPGSSFRRNDESRIFQRPPDDNGGRPDRVNEGSPQELLLSAFKPAVVLPVLAYSFALQCIGAVMSQLFFRALGYDLPFLVNLFVTPLIMLVFTLPISFAGLGIREGVFILFYGAFGVPAETALLVSFCGLASVLLGHVVGILLFFVVKRQRSADAETADVIPRDIAHPAHGDGDR